MWPRVQVLRSARNDRNLNDEFQRLRLRIETTRAPLLIAAVLAHGETDDPNIIAALASLIFLYGGHHEPKGTDRCRSGAQTADDRYGCTAGLTVSSRQRMPNGNI